MWYFLSVLPVWIISIICGAIVHGARGNSEVGIILTLLLGPLGYFMAFGWRDQRDLAKNAPQAKNDAMTRNPFVPVPMNHTHDGMVYRTRDASIVATKVNQGMVYFLMVTQNGNAFIQHQPIFGALVYDCGIEPIDQDVAHCLLESGEWKLDN